MSISKCPYSLYKFPPTYFYFLLCCSSHGLFSAVTKSRKFRFIYSKQVQKETGVEIKLNTHYLPNIFMCTNKWTNFSTTKVGRCQLKLFVSSKLSIIKIGQSVSKSEKRQVAFVDVRNTFSYN